MERLEVKENQEIDSKLDFMNNQISLYLKDLGVDESVSQYYETVMGEKYIGNLTQTKRLFSVVYIKFHKLTLLEYLSDLGINKSFENRKVLYKNMFGSFYSYKGTKSQNLELFHALVIKYEVARIVDAYEDLLDLRKQLARLKQDVSTKNDEFDNKKFQQNDENRTSSIKKTQLKQRNQLPEIEKQEKTLNSQLIEKIKQEFGEFDIKSYYENLWGEYDGTLGDNKRVFTYLYLKKNKITLNEFVQKLGFDLNKKSQLYYKFVGSLGMYKGGQRQNVELLHKLVEYYVLGKKYFELTEIKRQTPFDYEKLGLNPHDLNTCGAIYIEKGNKKVSMCSRTVREDLYNNFSIQADRGDSKDLYDRWTNKGGVCTIGKNLKKNLRKIFLKKGTNVADICLATNNFHRIRSFLGKDGNIYLFDEYYSKTKTPVLLDNYPLINSNPNIKVVINSKSYNV